LEKDAGRPTESQSERDGLMPLEEIEVDDNMKFFWPEDDK